MKKKQDEKSKVQMNPENGQTEAVRESDAAEQVKGEAVEEERLSEEKKKLEAQARKKRKLKKAVRNLVVKILVLVLVAFSVWNWVGEIYIIHTNSMYPHVKDGALLVISKIGEPAKEDVVLYDVFDYGEVGRIVGVPGDIIEMSDNGLFMVNGQTPYENVFYQTSLAEGSPVEYPYKLRPGEYFILNDMRETKEDSRIYGSINEADIRGKVVFMAQYRGI